ncbi:MAG TPA: pyruvate dehydrogenase complex dihydrolipoamide acetyltransferase [Chitinophagaceae bacterium]|nr:pyruvate dehydrogenase complex dihydrolipoamide acetyltransferase [Chitinophagaceae bacterium]
MAEVILMPRLSDTMTEGVIAAWHKKVGDKVKKGDLLAEIETDKATMELESYKDGVLLHIGSEKGGKLQVNDLLAIIGSAGEDISALLHNKPAAIEKKKPQTTEIASDKTEKKSEPAVAPAIDISKMEAVVLMPRLSDTMTEGVIASWHKNVGDTVKKGEILAEIETDKATMELESYKNGTLLYAGAKQGDKIQVNDLLCIIGEKGKVNVEEIVAAAKGGITKPEEKESAVETKKETVAAAVPATSSKQASATEGNERVKASPLAKKIAKEKGIDISNIAGSGDGGRIIKSDLDNYDASKTSVGSTLALKPVPAFVPVPGEEGFTDIPNSQIRTIIAKRLTESKFSAPHFYLTMEINMDNAISFRTQLNEVSPVKVSFNDLVVKAAALSLRQHPAVNASWIPAREGTDGGDKIRRYHHIHIGIAVAIEDGLIVPVIRFADQKSFPQIAAESKELAAKAKNKKLQPSEFSGNTFTISNLGMMDVDEFTAIINPPDSCIMAVGRIKETVVKKDNGFGVSQFMKVTMSCDHRSVDGALGAAFLQTFKKLLESPVGMMM